MKQPLITVVIPVYNIEPYIKECLDSISAQTYENLEILLVDDGSPDNCGRICEDCGTDGTDSRRNGSNGGRDSTGSGRGCG